MGDKRPAPAVPPTEDIPALVLPGWMLEAMKDAPVLRELAGQIVGTFYPPSLKDLTDDGVRSLGQAFHVKTPADAPQKIRVDRQLTEQFDALFKAHLNEGQNERGGTLVVNSSGGWELANQGSSRNGNHFLPDLKVGSGSTVVGTFHTHVDTDRFLKSESNPKGLSNTAPGGGDIAYALEKKLPFTVVKAATMDFMLVRTEATPTNVDTNKLRAEYQAALDAGKVTGRNINTTEDVTQRLAREYAAKYGFAYYEGKDGLFTRVQPPS